MSDTDQQSDASSRNISLVVPESLLTQIEANTDEYLSTSEFIRDAMRFRLRNEDDS